QVPDRIGSHGADPLARPGRYQIKARSLRTVHSASTQLPRDAQRGRKNAMRFAGGLTFLVVALISTSAQAQYTDGVVKIGVLSAMSSLYADFGGPGSVAAAKLAVEDFDPVA